MEIINKSKLKTRVRKIKYTGFTLFETILAMFILSLICLLFFGLVKNAEMVTKRVQNDREKEWQVFLIQLENEVKDYNYIETLPDKLLFKNKRNKHQTFIEYKLEKIVKVENGGFQPLLMNVKAAMFVEKNRQITITVTFDTKQVYSGQLTITREHLNEKL